MKQDVTFIHTAKSNEVKFDDLMKTKFPSFEVKHIVNEEILANSIKKGEVDKDGFIETISLVEDKESIICTCSTFGDVCDELDVRRIDSPLGAFLVSRYKRIALVFSSTSTLAVSRRLLQKEAKAQDKEIEIVEVDCTKYWRMLLEGRENDYVKAIELEVVEALDEVDAVFLAQASMSDLEPRFSKSKVPVLSSPEFGLKSILCPFSVD